MSFKSFNNILGALENQPSWESVREFQRLLKSWPDVVGAAASSQTRPLGIQRGVLQVAASSSAWTQELTLRRSSILKKLNAVLGEQLTDIRFSTAQWQNKAPVDRQASVLWEKHPSRVVEERSATPVSQVLGGVSATAAFEQWAALVRSRSQHLPLCPACECPTPPGELQRWNVCSLCATRQWQDRQP
jgi:predicted nucleic acid-binding Zn ribbon protein